ncbi:MAG: hypothetical protein ACO3CD_06230 [Candidatus Nanopelagicaceae bacterium]
MTTVEGTPQVNEDWSAIFARQRRDRLYDAIVEFLHDDDVDAKETYDEMLKAVTDEIAFYKKKIKKAEDLRDLMLGYRHVDFNDIPDRY